MALKCHNVYTKEDAIIMAYNRARTYKEAGFLIDISLKEENSCIIVIAINLLGDSKQDKIYWERDRY